VYRDEAGRSHIDARFFVPLSAGWVGSFLRNGQLDFASNNMFYTYLRLRPGADPGQLTRKLPAFLRKYALEDLRASGFEKTLFLVNVPDLHLYDDFKSVITPTSSRTYLYVLLSVAVFTLLIACINFMNLSTAQSAKRATEVGIRKVLGAEQNALIGQFLAQSVILTLVALLVAGAAVVLLMPTFNAWTGKLLSAATLLDGRMVLTFLGLALVTGLLAGSYPAFYLSLFQPVHVLKGKFTNSLSAVTLRKALVVFQFVVSVGLVLAAFVIGEQMRFMKNQPLGFRQDQQIVIPFRNAEARDSYAAYRNEILRHKGVESAAGTMYYPGIVNPSDFSLYRAGQSVNQGALVKTNWVDYEYLQTLGVQPVQGRLFSRQFPADTNNRLVVNEATLRKFNIPAAQAVGQKLKMDWQGETFAYEIVGVVKDFHFESLHRAIQPYCFLLNGRPSFNYMVVRVNTAEVGPVLASLEREWKALRPDDPFAYSFLDADFQQNYQAEVRTARIVRAFTLLSILISCLGLFGLAAFAAQQRTKEIGIRKVLGAGVGSIILLLSKDFLKLVGIAIVVALPLGGWLMGRWLEHFAYRIHVSWGLCALAGGLAVGVAFLTISLQSIRAASADPVKSLKSE
jgi:putative ABC transport system permease protein